jgi:hypothetical protein
MSVYTPSAAAQTHNAAPAQQPPTQSQPGATQQDILASLPYLATLFSAAPTGSQAPGQQMQPQGFSLPFNINDVVNAVNTAASVANQLGQIGHQLGLSSVSPAGQQAPGQMAPQGFDIGGLLEGIGKAGLTVAQMALQSASPAGQATQQQMQPQSLFGLPDLSDVIKFGLQTAAGLASASPTGQPAQGQMRPQGFDIGDALSTIAPLIPLILLSASPTGQQATGQAAAR